MEKQDNINHQRLGVLFPLMSVLGGYLNLSISTTILSHFPVRRSVELGTGVQVIIVTEILSLVRVFIDNGLE